MPSSPSFAPPKVTEGFYIPSLDPPDGGVGSPVGQQGQGGGQSWGHAGGVDPSFIFNGAAQPSPYHHLHGMAMFSPASGGSGGGGGGKSGVLSDLDLGAFDHLGGDPSSPGHFNHHSPNPNNGTGSPFSNPSATFDDFNYRQAASSAAMFESLSQRTHPSHSSSLPHYLNAHSLSHPQSLPFSPSSPHSQHPQHQQHPAQQILSHPSRSPSNTSAGTDLFGQTAQLSLDSPNGGNNQNDQFGSYSSVGESLPPPTPAPSTSVPVPTTTTTAPKRRAGSTDRSRSTGVGKAPTSSTRSRSARRTSTTTPTSSYISSPTPIPSSTAPPPSSQQQHHQLAMSMPAFPNSASGVGSPWFASALSFAQSPADSDASGLDPTGWRPSNSVPSSAPVGGSSSKKKASAQLDSLPEDPSQKHAALLTEKRRKRRESHNAVERRRRDNINDRITELASLLPECLLDQVNAPEGSGDADGDSPLSPGLPPPSLTNAMGAPTLSQQAAAATAAGKPNKGIILAKSVEYIRYLQQLVELHSRRNNELEGMLGGLRLSPGGGEEDGTEGMSPLGGAHMQQHGQQGGEEHFRQAFGDGSEWLARGGGIKSEDDGDDRMRDE